MRLLSRGAAVFLSLLTLNSQASVLVDAGLGDVYKRQLQTRR